MENLIKEPKMKIDIKRARKIGNKPTSSNKNHCWSHRNHEQNQTKENRKKDNQT